ncbi:MAG: pyridoxine 5'-phosphate synthase, partial [Saprospiraceae bacterium]
MVRLSVNLNKVALIRNARGSNLPNLVQVAKDCERFGADGITVHPRPDQRHVRYDDIPLLRESVTTEFNIEGNPTKEFVKMVLENPPHQCTLVPDAPDALTSDAGWDTITHASFLEDVIASLHEKNIRVSIFMENNKEFIHGAKEVGTDRIELYTGPYAANYNVNRLTAIEPFKESANYAKGLGLGL